jgi:hypothetical protein
MMATPLKTLGSHAQVSRVAKFDVGISSPTPYFR